MSTAHTFVKVTLRERLYEKTGHIALYLDYYPPIRNPKTMKQTRREYLGLYIYAKPTCDALVKSASRGHEIRKSACRCHFFPRSGSLIPLPTSLGGMADQIR